MEGVGASLDRESHIETVANEPPKKKSRYWLFLLLVIALALFLRHFVFSTTWVDGPSMQPTLHSNQSVLVDKISYTFSKPKRFDVAVCKFENGDQSKAYIKRIIGLPYELIEIVDGVVYINNEPLEGDVYARGTIAHDMRKIQIPEGHYFLMGDNRGDSTDSVVLGTVPKEDIIGRGVCVIWPLNEIAWLTN